jgi:hypothetical protein
MPNFTVRRRVGYRRAGPHQRNDGIATHKSRACPLLLSTERSHAYRKTDGGLHPGSFVSISRYAQTARQSTLMLQGPDEAVSRASGDGSEPNRTHLALPVDIGSEAPKAVPLNELYAPKRHMVYRVSRQSHSRSHPKGLKMPAEDCVSLLSGWFRSRVHKMKSRRISQIAPVHNKKQNCFCIKDRRSVLSSEIETRDDKVWQERTVAAGAVTKLICLR